ncbi:MAG: CRISPR-associated endonuclease Cas6, partial [Phaeodactylibacter sp.]|nr:CRISPR-associated endonuclease Cas6 [Phaeodactylibacter sp.]
LFLRVQELDIEGRIYPLNHKGLKCEEAEAGYSESLHTYTFRTLWMALNQANYARFIQLPEAGRRPELERLLRGHILAAFKGMGVWLEPEQRILAQVQLRQKETRFKDQRMIAFEGQFTTNAVLPRWIGIGKAVSRGFGTVERVGD